MLKINLVPPQNTSTNNVIDDLLGLSDFSKPNKASVFNNSDIFGANTSPPTIAGFGGNNFSSDVSLGVPNSFPQNNTNSLFEDFSLQPAQATSKAGYSPPHDVCFFIFIYLIMFFRIIWTLPKAKVFKFKDLFIAIMDKFN